MYIPIPVGQWTREHWLVLRHVLAGVDLDASLMWFQPAIRVQLSRAVTDYLQDLQAAGILTIEESRVRFTVEGLKLAEWVEDHPTTRSWPAALAGSGAQLDPDLPPTVLTLAKNVLIMACTGGMPDTFWSTDSRILHACGVLHWTPEHAHSWAEKQIHGGDNDDDGE